MWKEQPSWVNRAFLYASAVALVGMATLLRHTIGDGALEGIPFITYFPAIALATLIGGFGPGVLAMLICSAMVWYSLLPPVGSFGLTTVEASTLLIFVVEATINVVIVALLNHSVAWARASESRQRFLAREIRHRTLNLFTVIRSIAGRTFQEGQTIAEAKRIFDGRLAALAQSYSLLEDAGWDGAPLVEIIKAEANAFSSRVTIVGCDVRVNAAAAQQFSLIVHELATNSTKYGALSVPGGRVTVTGTADACVPPSFCFIWSERDGPEVMPPQRKGFGTTLLVDAARQFSQEVQLVYEPEGLRYYLRTQLTAIVQKPDRKLGRIAEAA
jgi:two-component sensor histidine kinase